MTPEAPNSPAADQPSPARPAFHHPPPAPPPADRPATPTPAAHDVVVHAVEQLRILRDCLEEAEVYETTIRGAVSDLEYRLKVSIRANQRLDARLAQAQTAAANLDDGRRAVERLEALLAEVRSAEAATERRVRALLAEQQERFLRMLTEQQDRLQQAFDRQAEEFEARLASLGSPACTRAPAPGSANRRDAA